MDLWPVKTEEPNLQRRGEDLRVRREVMLCMSIWDMSTSVLRVGAKVGGMLPVEDLLSSYSTRQC